ncbi:hypothetical protein DNU06_15645 [Putridiphycobacter roseus]|uniref:Uncharacterized protein n=1 Tax=Putridiphycobacter roseus TaxID=2219161 RepID=A0A2W1MXP2_9FLAO|nr:hypothetical protein [Putridiphycobacter roseus]PZE15940.1 hypothetical protein DNU06_15645 [Putridiphycobacter roseus]
MKKLAQVYAQKPKQLFLVDGFGALISAFCLGGLLPMFEVQLGIPHYMLISLAIFPCLFAAFDFFCYFSRTSQATNCLNIIATVNIIYAALSLGLTIYHFGTMHLLGITYFAIEVIIVLVIGILEFKTIKILVDKNNHSLT